MWFFGRVRSPPSTVTAGVRSLFAFWTGGATASVGVVTPPAVGTVGGGRRHGYQGFSKRKWHELLEEIRLEQEALQAPIRAKKALDAIEKAERAAARIAEELLDEEAQQLARTLVSAERARSAVDALKRASEALRQIAEIQARLDEDEEEVLMLLLS